MSLKINLLDCLLCSDDVS